MERQVVVYHQGCVDGAAAALVAKLALPAATLIPKPAGAPLAHYYCPEPWSPSDEPERVLVYYLDLSPEPEDLHFLQCLFRGGPKLRIQVLDHHASAQERVDEGEYDRLCEEPTELAFQITECSGAAAALAHFGKLDAGLALLCGYAQDRDLWRFQLPRSREIAAYLQILPTDPAGLQRWEEERDEILSDGALAWVEKTAAVGHYLLQQQRELVERQAAKAKLWRCGDGPHCAVVNASVLIDETCELLLERFPEAGWAAAWRVDGAGPEPVKRWSLRSRAGSDVDVKNMARAFGGGGHKHAAGFVERPGQTSALWAL